MFLNRNINKQIKIINSAWVGQGDFGDEAMAYGLRIFLKKNNIDFITYYQQGEYPKYRSKDDLKISSLHKLREGRWAKYLKDKIFLKKFNALIVGGGSLLHSYESINWRYDLIKKMKNKNYKFFSANLGISLSPFKSPAHEIICGKYLNSVDVSIFRDNYSAKFAKKLCDNKKIIHSLDNILIFPELCEKELDEVKSVEREENLVGVMFVKKSRQEEIFTKYRHFEKFLSIINNILDRNKKIILFTLYIGNLYQDVELNELLKKQSKSPERIEIHKFNGDIFRTIREINRCESVVSMRLHGVISCYMLGIPFLSLEYNPKNHYFCDSINYPKELSFDFNSIKDLNEIYRALDFLYDKKERIYGTVLGVEDAAKIVSKNFDYLLKEMNKKLL